MQIPKLLNPKPRPYWHVDAKWVCGLLLLLFLGTSLLLYSLANLTNEKNGPRLAALIVGSMFIRGDDQQLKTDAREELAKQGGVIRPLPNMPSVTITEKDLELTPTEIKLKVFMPLTETIYQNGVGGTADQFAKTPEEREKFVKDAAVFNLFTKTTHDTLKKFFNITILLSLLFLLGVIYFSAGWGRLANPGLLLLVVSLPGSLLAMAILNTPKDGKDGAALGFLPPEFGQQVGNALSQSYNRTATMGLLLLGAAAIGKIVTTIIRKRENK